MFRVVFALKPVHLLFRFLQKTFQLLPLFLLHPFLQPAGALLHLSGQLAVKFRPLR